MLTAVPHSFMLIVVEKSMLYTYIVGLGVIPLPPLPLPFESLDTARVLLFSFPSLIVGFVAGRTRRRRGRTIRRATSGYSSPVPEGSGLQRWVLHVRYKNLLQLSPEEADRTLVHLQEVWHDLFSESPHLVVSFRGDEGWIVGTTPVLEACRIAVRLSEGYEGAIPPSMGLHRGDAHLLAPSPTLPPLVVGEASRTAHLLSDAAVGGKLLISPSIYHEVKEQVVVEGPRHIRPQPGVHKTAYVFTSFKEDT
ncbi:hypothetical protein Spith_0333 [Spirochaeta thermophila DSM 6578]|uniref:Uncharacterized protein n=1 Tax=Winmispira thermophila (strain ATCC 700085 / DSM 6578 / Z-1203) TaxID=869211 RepID=G0GDY7_WINT7|nr:hypothetical protein Spith_0333 [Spirochaeta thermophila DSM 6578]